ncbi:MAG: zf-HC2 domain-containing protein, partial [Nocardioides sp.]
MPESPRCAVVRELLPELAMGVAPGDARASALAHVAGCASCREALAETAAV